MRDGGRPSVADLQGLATNYCKRLSSKVKVVSVTEKALRSVKYGTRRRIQVNSRSSVEIAQMMSKPKR